MAAPELPMTTQVAQAKRRQRPRLLPSVLLLGALAFVSTSASGFLPAPAGLQQLGAPEREARRAQALGAAAAAAAVGAALPAVAQDVSPLAHGTEGVLEEGFLQGIFERCVFGGLLTTTIAAWWKATVGGAKSAEEGRSAPFWLLTFSCTSLVALISNRWYDSGHFPLSNMYESLMFLAWGVTAVAIYYMNAEYTDKAPVSTQQKPGNSTGDIAVAMASPTALGIVAFAILKLPKALQKASSLVPALQSDWLVMHVSVVMLAYSTLMFGSVLCMAVLALSQPKDSPITAIREAVVPTLRGLANNLAPQPQPSLATSPQVPMETMSGMTLTAEGASPEDGARSEPPAPVATASGTVTVEYTSQTSVPAKLTDDDQLALTLDDLAYRSLLLGFGFLTVGIVSGAVWANEAWGNYWSWDPKETWALICWLVYAGYLHTRLQLGWDTRDSSKIGAFGFFIVWICYIGVNLMGIGLHSYGFFLK